MKRVTRQEIMDYVTYEEQRKQIREKIMKIKELRRINLAGVLSLLFENTDRVGRSEERRVWKECWARWARYRLKKNGVCRSPGELKRAV